jgi:hypothetical protein
VIKRVSQGKPWAGLGFRGPLGRRRGLSRLTGCGPQSKKVIAPCRTRTRKTRSTANEICHAKGCLGKYRAETKRVDRPWTANDAGHPARAEPRPELSPTTSRVLPGALTITLLSPRTLTLTKVDNYQLTTDNSSTYLLQYRQAATKKTVPVNTLTAPPATQQHCSIADSMANSPCHLRNDKIPSKENPSARVTRLRPAKTRLKFLDIGSFPQIERLFTSRGLLA